MLFQINLELSAHDKRSFQIDITDVGDFKLAILLGLSVDHGVLEDKGGPFVGIGELGGLQDL